MTPRRSYPVLLVENNVNDLLFIERAIAKAGLPISLHIVEHGEKAVQYLKGIGVYADRIRHPLPELILSNMKMPRMNGLELLYWMKQQPSLKQIPMVVMSSSDDPDEMERFVQLGVSAYFIKPVSLKDLTETLKRVVSLLPPLKPEA